MSAPLALLFPILMYFPSHAGTVRVETTIAAEVYMNGIPVMTTYGAGTVSIPDMPAGVHTLEVFRFGKPRNINISVPETGTVRLLIGEDTLTTDTPPADGATPPTVRLVATPGQQFSILVDGKRVAVLQADLPLALDHLGPGTHSLEVRSADNLTIWVRGTLDLEPGDDLRLTLTEGRLPELFGRAEAWRPR